MQRLLWSMDENQANVHVLRATMEEKAEIMDKETGHLNKLQCKAPPRTATSKGSSRLKNKEIRNKQTRKQNMDPGPESHTGPQVPLSYEQQQFLNVMLEGQHHQDDENTPEDKWDAYCELLSHPRRKYSSMSFSE